MRYEFGYDKEGEKVLKEKDYKDDLKKAVSGEMSWDDLKNMHPDKIDKINKLIPEYTPIEKSAEFQKATGPISKMRAYFNEDIASINEATQEALDTIKTEGDFNRFLENADKLKEMGVDVDAVLEYFGRRH